jgi:hypothetical protein
MRKTRKYLGARAGGQKRYECLCGNIEPASHFYGQFSKYRSGKNLHEIRDTVKTIIPNLAGVDRTLVAFFAGHQSDPLDYEKLRDAEKYGLMNEIRKNWSKALPYLNLWSQASDLTTSPTNVADLQDQLNKTGLEIMQLKETTSLIIGYLSRQVHQGADRATLELIDKIRKQANTITL